MPLPHHLLILGAVLLLLGGLAGPIIAFGLPRASRYRRGIFALLPQLAATLGAASCVLGWVMARRTVVAWKQTDVIPAPALKASLDQVIAWKEQLGFFQAGIILICLVLAALPIWRGQVTEKT